ncbi:MAG TPA: universal stress protein [Enhygromyxa sp.]|nr:universal stress protein [Enhygromyxa sp.]
MLRSVLVSVDLSPASDRVIGRAALLPLTANARLTLLHVVPKLLPPNARKRAEGDAHAALEALAEKLAAAAPEGVVIRTAVKVGSAAAEIAKHARSVKAELILMGRGGGRAIRDVFLGSTAERVIRHGQLPVLVVRLAPRGLYSRPALAMALDAAADDAIRVLLRVIPPPRPTVALIHAYDVPFQATVYPSLSAEEADEYRVHHQHKARREIGKLLSTTLERAGVADQDAPAWKLHVRLGSARTVIERVVERTRTDLLVLGTHGHVGVAHAFLGTVAGDVLREVACDALVVPPDRDESESS